MRIRVTKNASPIMTGVSRQEKGSTRAERVKSRKKIGYPRREEGCIIVILSRSTLLNIEENKYKGR